jgi:hypothetical protein
VANRRISELQELAGLDLVDQDLLTVVHVFEVDPTLKNRKLTVSGTKQYLNQYYLPHTGGTVSGALVVQGNLTVSGSTNFATATFTGAVAEVTVDTTKKVVVVHDGITAGGIPGAKQADVSAANVSIAALQANVGLLRIDVNSLDPGGAAGAQAQLQSIAPQLAAQQAAFQQQQYANLNQTQGLMSQEEKTKFADMLAANQARQNFGLGLAQSGSAMKSQGLGSIAQGGLNLATAGLSGQFGGANTSSFMPSTATANQFAAAGGTPAQFKALTNPMLMNATSFI